MESDDYRPEDREYQKKWLLERVEEEAADMMHEVRLREQDSPDYNVYGKGFREGLMRAYAKTAVQFGLVDDEMMHDLIKSLTGETDFDPDDFDPKDES